MIVPLPFLPPDGPCGDEPPRPLVHQIGKLGLRHKRKPRGLRAPRAKTLPVVTRFLVWLTAALGLAWLVARLRRANTNDAVTHRWFD